MQALYWLALATAVVDLAIRPPHWPGLLVFSGLLLHFFISRPRGNPPGAVLCWNHGRWTLARGGKTRAVVILRSHCLPWVTYVQWRASGGDVGYAWLFGDGCDAEQLRRLRVRLALER